MTNELSPADIRACCGDNNNGGLFGGDGIVGLIALFLLYGMMGGGMWGGMGGMNMWLPWLMGGGMWGGSMWGGYGAQRGGVQDGYVLASDMARVQQSITAGLCDGFYNTAQQINGVQMQAANNTAALQSTLTQGFAGLNTGMRDQGYETRIAVNGIGQQLANCCCEIREGIAGVNYNNAIANAGIQRQISDTGCGIERQVERGFCDAGYRDATNTTAIVQNAHNDADRIIARIDRMESDRQAERIQQLTADNNALRFQISQDRQTTTVIDKLGYHCPVSAYVVQPPQQVTFPTNCCGGVNYAAASGCGCGM